MSSAKKRTPRRNRKAKSPGPRRLTKKTGDVRSLPEAKAGGAGAGTGALTGRAIRHLRGLGHHLEPVVQIGKEGITDAVVAATRVALHAHELVKIRIGGEAPIDRKEAGDELAARAGATLAQTLGRTLLLYKRHPHKPKIELPR
jgi:RNA-binding protein